MNKQAHLKMKQALLEWSKDRSKPIPVFADYESQELKKPNPQGYYDSYNYDRNLDPFYDESEDS